jgi:outer membrane protein assembly factor BamE (lipoprotein component of BamABCDE complex)
MTRYRGILLPAALLGLAIYVLIGCIPVPGNYKPAGGKERPESNIGLRPDAKKPLHLRISTREQVRYVLGEPTFATPDGRAWGFSYSVNTMSVFWPLCFFWGVQPTYDPRHLLIHFDDDGKLRSYQVYKNIPAMMKDAPPAMSRTDRMQRPPTQFK